MTRPTPSFRLRTVGLVALFSFATFAVQAAPTEFPIERPEALTPQPAKALACADGPEFEGYITDSSSSTTHITESTTGNVYARVSDVIDDWSCTAWYRYDGLAWVRDDGEEDGNFDWGNLINSTSVSCNWIIDEANYLKANSTNDCPDYDAEYAMPIFLANTSTSGDLLEWIFHNDGTPDEPGDFLFIHSDCETYYGAEEISWNQPFTTSDVDTRPGSNCDPYDPDSTNTTQTIVVDDTPPPTGSVSINGGATWAMSTAVTLTVSASDNTTESGSNVAGVSQMRFSNDGSTWGSWTSYATSASWTVSTGSGTKTVRAQFRDANLNATPDWLYSDTIGLDVDEPTGSITIDGGATSTTSTAVILTLTNGDTGGSGASQMRFQNESVGWSSYEAVAGTKAWTLSSGAGTKTVYYQVKDVAGNERVYSDTIVYAPDVSPPDAPDTPDLDSGSDTGSSDTDNVTFDATPTLFGDTDSVEANAAVKLRIGGTLIGSGSANSSGAWSITTSSLSDGTHDIKATATDAATNESSESAALSVTIDTGVPSAPSTPDLQATSDTGGSTTDNTTNDTTPSFDGTAESGTVVTIFAGGAAKGSSTAVGGTWSVTTSALTDGATSITAKVKDAAGNESSASSALSVTIDATAPSPPSTPNLDTASDSGVSSTDDVTNDATPTLSGSAESGASITLSNAGGSIGTGTATGGSWSITATTLGEAVHAISAVATDLAGNASSASSALSVTVDTTAPATPPGTPDLDAGSDTGLSVDDDITNDTTPTLAGTATNGDIVEVRESTTALGSATASSGAYSITVSTLADGVHVLTAVTTDLAGNASSASATLSVTIDATAPVVDFTTPASGFATQTIHELDVTWTETETGSGVATRSIQRQAVAAVTTGTCTGLTFVDDGDPTTDASPRAESDLGDVTCYRWTAAVEDIAGNTGTDTSGQIQTDLLGTTVLRVRVAPTSVVGATTYVSVAVEDGAGKPVEDYLGLLTIETDDAGAVFPDGDTFQLTAAAAEKGHTFRVLFSEPGSFDIDVSGPSATTGVSTVTVSSAALRAAAPETVYQGIPFKLAVIPRIGSKTTGAINKAYAATVEFASSDTTAEFGDEVDGSDEYVFVCNCEGSHVFPTTLTDLGTQTVTVTDEFGTTDTVTVDVVAPSGSGTDPITRIDILTWWRGSDLDYYVTATDDYELLWVEDSCGWSTHPLHETGIRMRSGGDMTRALGDPDDPINDGILTSTAIVDTTYAEGSIGLDNGRPCGSGDFFEPSTFGFTYTDGLGHLFSRSGVGGPDGRWREFADIPGHANFIQQGPDQPIVDFDTVSRGGTTSSTFVDPNTSGEIRYVPQGLEMSFTTNAPISIYRVQFQSIATYDLGPGFSEYELPAGTSTIKMNDVPFHNSCLQAGDTTGGRIYFSGPGGRHGSIADVSHLWPESDFPNPGPPLGWGCDGEQSNPTETGDSLRDALDRLGIDDLLGVVDTINSISHMTVGDPIDAASGAQLGASTDFDLGGLTPALRLERRYRSDVAEAVASGGTPAADADSLLGVGWSTNLDWRLTIAPTGDTILVRGDGVGAVTFSKLDNDDWSGPAWFRMSLAEAGGDFELTRPTGDGFRFDGDGWLEAIFDQQGHEMTVDYDGSGHVEAFTDAAGREAEVTTNGAGHATRIDLPDGRYVTYAYNAAGFLTSVRMVDGNTMTYVTDDRGRITRIKDPLGRTVLADAYDGRGRVVRQTDALGNRTYVSHDRVNLVTMTHGPRGDISLVCTNPDGSTRATLDALDGYRDYTYDQAAHVTAATDELGATTRFGYDAAGNPSEVIDALGRTVTSTYDAKGRPTEVVGTDGSTLTTSYDPTTGGPEDITRDDGTNTLVVGAYTYDAAGLPETIVEPGGATTTLAYDSDGYLESTIDAEGRETTYVTDARGFVTISVDPLGNASGGVPADHTTVWTYDDAGRVLTIVDALDNTTTYSYDEMGRLETALSPLGKETVNVYDAKGQLRSVTRSLTELTTATTHYEDDDAGNLTAVEDPEGRRTEFTYDLLDRLIETHDADGNDWGTTYDAAGRIASRTDPTGATTTTIYDAIGRAVSTTDAAGKVTEYEYDAAGRLELVRDPLDHETIYGYDWMGRQSSVTNALDDESTAVFNDAGDVESVTNARGKTTTFDYDLTHRLTSIIEPGGIETLFTYDDAGRLETRTNDRGAVETYDSDALGRPTGLLDPVGKTWTTTYDDDGRVDTTIDGEGQTVDYAFDLAGRLLTLDPDTGSTITFSYDDSDRVLQMADGAGTTTYDYDDVGHLTSSSRASRTTTYGYDDAGRLDQVVYPASLGTVGLTYDEGGRLETITDWASRATTYTYDDASRVTDIARPGGLTTEVDYDELDRPESIVHARSGAAGLTLGYTYDENGNVKTFTDDSGTATFTYDDLDRLTAAAFPSSQDYAYGYDAVGNLTSRTTPSGSITRTYDLGDRITTSGYTYDDNGDLTADPTRSYTYDGFGRLTGVTVGATSATYALDGAGNRTAQTVGGVTTSFDVDLSAPNPTILSDGTRTYLPGDPSAGYEQSGTWWNALADELGSPIAYLSTAGSQTGSVHYDPYGAARPGSTIATGIGYGGEWLDGTGLINLRARAYDPAIGRFVSRDGFAGVLPAPQTANRYSYALNGPYRYRDPSGHFVNAVVANAPLLVSIGVQSFPGVGDVYSALTGLIGFDPIAGISLTEAERAAAIASAVVLGGGFGLLGRLGDDVADASRVERAGGELRAGEGGVTRRPVLEVFNARTSRATAESVAVRVDPGRFKETARFGKALYVSESAATAVKELAYHGELASSVIHFRFDVESARILDLTDSAVARRLGYAMEDDYVISQEIARAAKADGYDAIRYQSLRGEAVNYAILQRFDELLKSTFVEDLPG